MAARGALLALAALCLQMYLAVAVNEMGMCLDIHGRLISPGIHFIPGPGTCTLCICDRGLPKWCKAVLCSPPQDCKSFRVGSTCCDFICLDETIKEPELLDGPQDVTLRIVASVVTAMLFISVAFFLMYRIRQRKLGQNSQLTSDDQRSLNSIGFIGGSMGYMGGVCESGNMGYPMWKPPGNYFPRGEAPPPYEEAVAQARVDAMRLNPESNGVLHRDNASNTAIMDSVMRHENSLPPRSQPSGHSFTNLPRSMAQQVVFNQQGLGFNAPLLQPFNQSGNMNQPEARDNNHMQHHAFAQNVPLGFKLTGSLGTITNRGLLNMIQRTASHHQTPLAESEPPSNMTSLYSNPNNIMGSSLHRTIPRLLPAGDIFGTRESNFNRASSIIGHPRDRIQYLEMRRSFHKPGENNRPTLIENGRSIPRDLNLTSIYQGEYSRQMSNLVGNSGNFATNTDNFGPQSANISSARASSRSNGESLANLSQEPAESSEISDQEVSEQLLEEADKKPSGKAMVKLMGLFNEILSDSSKPSKHMLPVLVDKPLCVCYTDSAGGDDADGEDYHSECENCKTTSSSRWVLEGDWDGEEDEGTQTLQRRAPPSAAPPPATSTLPQPVTKQSRMPGASNWENWFSVIQDSSSSEED